MTREEAHRILSNGLVNAPSEHEWCMAFDMAIKALEIVEEFEKAQIITGGRLNGRTYAYKCGLEDGKRKVLEQQPSEDVISRQAVLDIDFKRIVLTTAKPAEIIRQKIQELPSVTPTQKWIPVSERLPKPSEYVDDVAKYYLVQNEYGDMLVARYTHSGYWKQIYQLQPIDDDVVAWMPLPESYKAEMESE